MGNLNGSHKFPWSQGWQVPCGMPRWIWVSHKYQIMLFVWVCPKYCLGNSNWTGILYFYWLNLAILLGSQVCTQHSLCLLQVSPCSQTESTVLPFLAGCSDSPKEGSDPQPRPPESLPRMSVSDFEKMKLSFPWRPKGVGMWVWQCAWPLPPPHGESPLRD